MLPQKNTADFLPFRLSKLDTDARSVIIMGWMPWRLDAIFWYIFVKLNVAFASAGFLWPSSWSNPHILELMCLLAGMPLGKVTASDYLQEANVSICKCENCHQQSRSVGVFHPAGDQ